VFREARRFGALPPGFVERWSNHVGGIHRNVSISVNMSGIVQKITEVDSDNLRVKPLSDRGLKSGGEGADFGSDAFHVDM
jgi:hypothetical protein